MFTRRNLLMLMTLTATGCASRPAVQSAAGDAGASGAVPRPADRRLNDLLEAWFEDQLRLNPLLATFIGDNRYDDQLPNSIGPEYRAQARALDERYLQAARGIDPAQLSAADRISYDIFVRERSRSLEAERFPSELLPIDQAGGLLNVMPALGSGNNAQPFATAQDYDRWLRRLDGLIVWMDQAIVNMRIGMARGVVQPRPVMQKVLPQLAAMIVETPEESAYFAPLRHVPAAIGAADRERLAREYAAAIGGRLVPAYRRLHDFVQDEYLPRARDSVAWIDLPDGAAWYVFAVQEHTTTTQTPDEIHALGLAEVARIRGEMDAVRVKVGFVGTLAEFFRSLQADPRFYYDDGEQLLQGFREIKQRIAERLPRQFSVFPKADYEVRAVEAFRAASAAGGYYQPASADGSRPGIFYVNTYNLHAQPKYGMETLSLHEASPGHHFQLSIQQELQGVPRFRRFGSDYTAYVEGWALYAESLGPELGLFTDPYQWFGRLNDEMLRAMRLVVDTGLHAHGWSRERAIRYMLDNSALAETDVVSEVERYIAWPGQALGYKVGDLHIQGLRRRATQSLGAKFDLRDFHREMLCDGAVPLDVLDGKIDRWMAGRA